MQKGSLDFARDDGTRIAIYKHIRCTLRGIDPFPHTVISSVARNLSCTPLLLASFVKGFPFSLSHMGRYTGMQKGSLHFGRDDDTGIAIHKHIRCTLRGIDPFPHAVMRGAARNLSCTPSFLAPFAKGFPFSAITHTALYTIPSFRAQREIFLALRHFLNLSRKVSHFPLSHIGRYTAVQKRSPGYARDDGIRIAIFKHITAGFPLFRCLT